MARISSSVILMLVAASATCSLVSCFDQTLCAGSDSTGRCSPDPYPVPTLHAQDNMFTDFSLRYFDVGNTPGCYSIGYVRDDDGYRFRVYASFTCDGEPSVECRQCLRLGFDRMEYGCRARAGGTVLLENCCFRYELYNICPAD